MTDARVYQDIAQALIAASADARVYQEAIEALAQAEADGRVFASSAEALVYIYGVEPNWVRVPSVYSETVVASQTAAANAYGAGAEATILNQLAAIEMSMLGVEVLIMEPSAAPAPSRFMNLVMT